MKTNIEYCKTCGEIIFYTEDKYDIYAYCDCVRRERTKLKIAKYKKLSITDREFGNNIFENCETTNDKEKAHLEKFKKYSERFKKALNENIGILMAGLPGTGKTFYANCIANEIQSKGYTVLSFNLSGYLRKIQEDYSNKRDFVSEEEKLLHAVKEVDLLIIDDLGSEKLTDWGIEKVYNLIDERYKIKKPIIITTNLNKECLEEHLLLNGSDKLLDRIKSMTTPFIFDWESRRKPKKTDIWD
ncbi:ATP-binding protein [uncultured Clostridium sp.]|uniref:ATP-binding protein n=1 Tax=uncultured Clostridium sp. TaxID=59620 RepID=UPI002630950E|nr:ATP-binding protein [uncultured Clostridium sp.]